MIPSKRTRVFTIPASVPFLPTLVRALVAGELVTGFKPRDPIELASATLYLPTKRACRMAREVFLDELQVEAAVLPRIVPLGSIDEDEFAFAESAIAADVLTLPPAIGGLERQALLAQLILKWAAAPKVRGAEGAALVANSPGAAFALAGELARLMDDMTTRQVPWTRLDDLVPSDLDRYWQYTLEFLKIAREAWPAILHARAAIEPAERRDRLIAAEAARLAATPDGPVIAAGSTGSMPATAALIATIARLPHGAVVLPGLDTHLDEPSWRMIGGSKDTVPASGHPQFGLQALLARMQIDRSEVVTLGSQAPDGRALLVSEALRPAESTHLWPQRLARDDTAGHIAESLAGLTLIEAANSEEESLAIAVALREAVAQGKTAALVTPDRRLARRVAAALARWDIAADDTAGEPLSGAPAGVFARLAAEVALGGLAPVPLLALLKHPLLRLDADADALRRGIAALERALLRGPRPSAGSAALRHALTSTRAQWQRLKAGDASEIHASDPRALLTAVDFDAAEDIVGRLTAALAPLESIARSRPLSFRQLAAQHQKTVEALSSHAGRVAAFAGEDGMTLAQAFDEIVGQSADADLRLEAGDYADLFAAAINSRTVHRHGVPGAQVSIYGLLEARLTETDRVVLGGLIEGVWPPEVSTDPWLSRPMRHALGLNLPELRIGLTAHDFAQMVGAREVIFTRASKVAGAPTVPSRFLQRLAAVAGADAWGDVGRRGGRYLAWTRALDRPARVLPIKRPEPRPPRGARPTSFSVTEIESWLRDPYTIYAKRILNLRPLDPVDTTPGAAERGSAIHEALAEFTQRFATALPDDPLAELLQIGRAHFAPLEDYPEARAFWWPRFQRIANWFVGWEIRRRAISKIVSAETRGRIEFPLGERRFTLRARADRIERMAGGYAILDYKTGRVPGHDEVKVGLSPQLTLEAAILRRGGFADVADDASVTQLVYVGLKGGEPGGEERVVNLKDSTPDTEADRALAELTRVALRFEDPDEPYRSLVHSMWRTRYGDFDHLARVKEWSLAGEEDGGSE
ncbi:MAG TPA: double-strand break repair protein AddB [Xanthobacteraceae bacterium]|nr:double-strand break repair protein AddB [Xanthobacteraceae bacterium]